MKKTAVLVAYLIVMAAMSLVYGKIYVEIMDSTMPILATSGHHFLKIPLLVGCVLVGAGLLTIGFVILRRKLGSASIFVWSLRTAAWMCVGALIIAVGGGLIVSTLVNLVLYFPALLR